MFIERSLLRNLPIEIVGDSVERTARASLREECDRKEEQTGDCIVGIRNVRFEHATCLGILNREAKIESRRLQGWGASLKKEWQRQAAGRMGAVEPLQLLAACVAWRLYEDAYRDTLQLRSEKPGWLAGNRLHRFNAKQLTYWTRGISNLRGCVNQSSPMSGWNAVSGLMLSYRAPTRLEFVSQYLGKIVGPRISQKLAEARREARALEDKQTAEARAKAAPLGINPDGTRDLYRSPQYIKKLKEREE